MTKKHEPTDEQRALVKRLATAGLNQTMIGNVIGIHRETLAIHYREELNVGLANVVAEMGGILAEKARQGDTASLIFFLKTLGRWSETVKQEISGQDGTPIEVNNNLQVEFIGLEDKSTD